ncbi:MAG TPA: DUF1566 domain-containing protein [Adhaeribacter sp.]|nr:DUF1566 domain-containing protein [Adhaeribacter sp.]
MKLTYTRIFKTFAAAALLALSALPAAAQMQRNVCSGETLTLNLGASRGAIQWQQSADQTTWTNIAGATASTTTLVAANPLYLRAMVTDGTCAPVYSDVTQLIIQAPAPAADAGPDQLNVTATSVTLAANAAGTGATGAWGIVSGGSGTFSNANLPNSTFTGTPGATYVLRWEIQNACGSTTDDVSVSFVAGSALPTISCQGAPLYIHPTDNSTGMAWGCSGVVAGASSTTDGQTNTATIIGACAAGSAAQLCDDLVAFGYSDWYLPARDELTCVHTDRASLGTFAQKNFWSSTEGTGILTANAYYRSFTSTTNGFGSKSNQNAVRCVRK